MIDASARQRSKDTRGFTEARGIAVGTPSAVTGRGTGDCTSGSDAAR
jgi:hypothetical protein